jgi:hypothetical protein
VSICCEFYSVTDDSVLGERCFEACSSCVSSFIGIECQREVESRKETHSVFRWHCASTW